MTKRDPRPSFRRAFHLLILAAIAARILLAVPAFAVPANFDALAQAAKVAPSLRHEVAEQLVKPGTRAHYEPRLDVPTFLWAAPRAVAASSAGKPAGPEAAAREHLARYAGAYRLTPDDTAQAKLLEVHDTGRGGVIARFGQEVGGVEIFRSEIKVLMDRNLALVALSGYLSDRQVPSGAAFRLSPSEAIAVAMSDFTGATVPATALRATGESQAAYQYYAGKTGAVRAAGYAFEHPTRVKPVYFDLPSGLVPAYYLELEITNPENQGSDYFSYVVSADDGRLLLRNNLTADASYAYTVWAETSGQFRPMDGPEGTDPTPHNTNDGFQAPFISPNVVNLESGPIGTGDPWLPANATETTGNNVEAYVDLFSPDGFSAGDFHGAISAPGTFNYVEDFTQQPSAVIAGSQSQRMASITQLFFNINFFHDWYYDSGFNEISGNAQNSNYGRGGLEADSIKAEGQDFSGRNNANMSTPADGARPRMQMFLFDGLPSVGHELKITVNTSPNGGVPLPTGDITTVGTAVFGPTTFVITQDVVRANPPDGCGGLNINGASAFTNAGAIAGKIVLIDRGGSCAGGFAQKAQNAQLAAAAGVIIANVSTSANPTVPPGMGGTPAFPITIGVLSLNLATGDQFRNALPLGTVNITMNRNVLDRDGTLDNQIQAHEWGHYISNRLVGNSSGLTNNLGRGLGEGWADFHAMLLTVRSEDTAVTGNDQFQGAYALGGYATPAFSSPSHPYYFGIRRYPYSTDMVNFDPLTYKHISDGQALPAGPPVNTVISGNGAPNSEVHNTGEIWATMLWECYAGILQDTLGGSPRLTFDQALGRMKDYIVGGYKMTPNAPTLLEARDAILAVAYANDPIDYVKCAAGFAKRGAGALAKSPDRFSINNLPADATGGPVNMEDYTPPIALALTGATITDDVTPNACGADGILQHGETGNLTITLKNLVPSSLASFTGTLATVASGVTIVTSQPMTFPSVAGLSTVSLPAEITLDPGFTGTQIDFTLALTDSIGTLTIPFSVRVNYVVSPAASATDDVESPHTAWTPAQSAPWKRVALDASHHEWLGSDLGVPSDVQLWSPPLLVNPSGSFSFGFTHRYQFEFSSTAAFDGGVVEISTDNGATWTDVGAASFDTTGGKIGYSAATIATGGLNPIEGRRAFVAVSSGFPAFKTSLVNLGTAFQGKTVRVRFRIGSDVSGNLTGWEIDNISFSNIANTPFDTLVEQVGACTPPTTPPTAYAGNDQSVTPGILVTLDGRGSTSPNGGITSYAWTQVGGPAVALTGATTSQPTFTSPAVTPTSTTVTTSSVLTFQLVVTDSVGSSQPSLVTVTDINPDRVPVANAGTAQTVNEHQAGVQLNGAGSTDADSDPLTYAWSQTGGPAVTLSSNTAQKPTFTAPEVSIDTTLTFQLVVNDGQVSGAPVTTTVLVKQLACAINSLPITAPAAVCSGSTGNSAAVPPPVGPPPAFLGGPPYTWGITNGSITAGQGTNAITFTAAATGPVHLTVAVGTDDCTFNSSTDVAVTALPDATITVPSAVCAASTGNSASVPDAGVGASYSWGITGGTINLSGNFTNAVSWTAGGAGTATLSATVTLNGCSASSSSAPVTINAIPAAPTASSDSPVCEGSDLHLQATGAAGTYSWTGPDAFTSSDQNPTRSGVTLLDAGVYQATVTVAGCTSPPGSTAPVVVNARPTTPTVNAPSTVGPSVSGIAASTANVAGVTYLWSLVGGGSIDSGQATTAISLTSPAAPGSFDVHVVETDANSCASLPGNATIAVFDPAAGTDMFTLTPCRVFDTRDADGPLGGPPLSASSVRSFPLFASSCAIPATARAVAVNVTVVAPGAQGFLQMGAGNQTLTGTTVISFSTGVTRANNAIVALATDGSGTILVGNGSAGSVDVLLDVVGYFQ